MSVYSFSVYLAMRDCIEKFVVADTAEAAMEKLENNLKELGYSKYFIMQPYVVGGMENVII